MAAVAPALPNWVMLERFAFKSLRGDTDPRTTTTGTTSTGTSFQVSFVVAEPPTPSRMYISWPEGPDCATAFCNLGAAHRDLVLLGLDITEPSGEFWYEYFVYIAHPTSQDWPLLRRLPKCVAYDDDIGETTALMFHSLEVGLLCHGEEDEFAVASLGSVRWCPEESEMKANLWVLRSSRSYCGDAAAQRWERKQVRIPYQQGDEYYADMLPWRTCEVVPFNNSLCFVNYAVGILVCDGILGDSPRVAYIRFPVNSIGSDARMALYRSVCVADGGSRLSFVDVARQDERIRGPVAPGTGFTLTVWTLAAENTGTCLRWQPSEMVTSDQLWAANHAACLPRDLMLYYPLLSMDVPSTVHTLLLDSGTGSLSLAAINLSDRKVLGSVLPYIKILKGRISADDAELAERKYSFFVHFLPSEFPKFLNISRSIEGEPPASHVLDSRKRKVPA